MASSWAVGSLKPHARRHDRKIVDEEEVSSVPSSNSLFHSYLKIKRGHTNELKLSDKIFTFFSSTDNNLILNKEIIKY